MTRRSPIRSTSIYLGAGAVLLLCIVLSMIYLVFETQASVGDVARTRQLRSAAADLLLALQDAETGQRGYILTQQNVFLKPYVASMGELQDREENFERTAAAVRSIQVDVATIRHAVAQKNAEMQRTIALAQAQRRDEALAIVFDESGLKLMNTLRSTLTDVIDRSDRQINAQFASNLDLAVWLRLTTIVGAVAVIATMAAVFLVIQRYVREIVQARGELESLNASLEERVRERTEDLIQANQEIQRFAYIVTHDLRAPLVNIMGFTSELDNALQAINTYFKAEDDAREDVRQDAAVAVSEDLPEAIQFIRTSTRKMDNLINAILKISRDGRRQLKPEPVDLEQVIRASADSIQHQVLEADGEVAIRVSVRRFISDRFSIEQILGNLLDNAVKYKVASRPLKLSIDAFTLDRLRVAINVRDNGRGVAPEDHERIFELFRRSGTQDSPGEGIGLAHVRSLVRNMGGDIQVRSELGKGTEFMIRLPVDLSQYVRSHGQ